MKVSQAGFACVALMGSSLSETQEELLVRNFKNACLMLDGDEAGRRATDDTLVRLGRRMWVRAVATSDGMQPDMLTGEDIAALLGNKNSRKTREFILGGRVLGLAPFL